MAEDLEKLYNPSMWSTKLGPEEIVENYFAVVAKNSATVKNTIPCTLNISYGNSEAQKIDRFGSEVLPANAPIYVHLHGGYWRLGCRQDSSFFAKPLVEAGIVCIAMGYDLVSDSVAIPDIVTEVKQGLHYILKYAAERGSRGVYISGHSAGAHLITMALSSEPIDKSLHNLIKGIIPVSGVFDLNPILKTTNAVESKVTEQIAKSSSPMTVVSCLKKNIHPATKILVVAAEHESPAFIQQSKDYEKMLKQEGIDSEYVLISDEDHFSVIEKLFNSDYILTKKIIEFIKKTGGFGL